MHRLVIIVCAAFFLVGIIDAQPLKNTSPAHASREAVIELLCHEGILHGKTTVVSADWNGTFWLISLRHSGGKVTNWTVDAAARDYSYVCKH